MVTLDKGGHTVILRTGLDNKTHAPQASRNWMTKCGQISIEKENHKGPVDVTCPLCK